MKVSSKATQRAGALRSLGVAKGTAASGSGKVSVNDITLTKHVDRSSPTLFRFCCEGRTIPKAWVTIRKAGATPFEYLKYTLTNVRIVNVTTGGNSGDSISESVRLNFTAFEVEYVPRKLDGSPDAAIRMGWDVAKNASI